MRSQTIVLRFLLNIKKCSPVISHWGGNTNKSPRALHTYVCTGYYFLKYARDFRSRIPFLSGNNFSRGTNDRYDRWFDGRPFRFDYLCIFLLIIEHMFSCVEVSFLGSYFVSAFSLMLFSDSSSAYTL